MRGVSLARVMAKRQPTAAQLHRILQEAISKCDVSPEAVCKMLDATRGDATVEEGSVVALAEPACKRQNCLHRRSRSVYIYVWFHDGFVHIASFLGTA